MAAAERPQSTAVLAAAVGGAALLGVAAGYALSTYNTTTTAHDDESGGGGGGGGEVAKLQTVGERQGLYEERPMETDDDEVLLQEQFARNLAFLGAEKFSQVRGAFVVVVGLGGVGSHAAHMLARSGVGKLRIVDFDMVTLSSLNRHAVATRADVGLSKAKVLKSYLASILPHTIIEAREEMFTWDAAGDLLSGNPDLVIDCIDNTPTKVDLLRYCVANDINVLCSMGAGARVDPSQMVFADISESRIDPLAREIRIQLRGHGILGGIPTVFSVEEPAAQLVDLDESMAAEADEYAPIADFRVRILPVIGTVPAAFGQMLASAALMKLAGQPIPYGQAYVRPGLYKKMHKRFVSRERKEFGDGPTVVTQEEFGMVIDQIWRGCSAISGDVTAGAVTRWDRSRPGTADNLVLVSAAEADKIDAATRESGSLPDPSVFGPEVNARVAAVFAREFNHVGAHGYKCEELRAQLQASVDGGDGGSGE